MSEQVNVAENSMHIGVVWVILQARSPTTAMEGSDMPDTQQQEQERLQQEQQRQQEWQQQQQQTQSGQSLTQSQFDSMFGEQMFGDAATREVHQQYWQNAEETLRQARRVSEIYTMSLMQQSLIHKVSTQVVPVITQQLTPIITQQVVQQFQQNPQLLKQAIQAAQQR